MNLKRANVTEPERVNVHMCLDESLCWESTSELTIIPISSSSNSSSLSKHQLLCYRIQGKWGVQKKTPTKLTT